LHEDEVFGSCFVEGWGEGGCHGDAFDVDGFEEVVVHGYCAGEADEHAFGGRWDPEGKSVHAFEVEVYVWEDSRLCSVSLAQVRDCWSRVTECYL